MLAPMRPRPIIPSCILSAPLTLIVKETTSAAKISSIQALRDCFRQCFKPRVQIFPEMNSQCATAAFGEHGEIPARLRGFDDTKRVFLARNGKVGCVVTGDLQEDAAVRPSFVGLSGRMQEARAKAEAGGNSF